VVDHRLGSGQWGKSARARHAADWKKYGDRTIGTAANAPHRGLAWQRGAQGKMGGRGERGGLAVWKTGKKAKKASHRRIFIKKACKQPGKRW